jgi:hypothetical protein
MASHYLRKYATATIIDFELYKLDGTGLKVDAASATHDIKIMKDEGAEADTTADAFVDEGQGYSLALTDTETTAARIVIYIVDQSNPQVWLDKVLIIETYGHASAQHTEGINIQTEVNKIGTITNTNGTATIGAVLGDMANSAVVTRLANAQTELNKIGTITNTGGTATLGAVLGNVSNSDIATRLGTIAGYSDTEISTLVSNVASVLKILKNKWAIVGSQLIYYDDNGSTPLYTFDLDSATAPTSRTPVP